MKESLQEEIEENTELPEDADLSEEVKKFVRRERNKVYNPGISTEEVATEFGISMETAHDALDESPHLDSKEVGDQHIWW
ncbi:hypothetical protein L593_12500 [Salinarchaeum sp. Harcht-Bsk1]|uniref:hypothetical protein n=1 Tax=Salinarchaeum sp. Harcht-Bsk1 TaxID=1333523 RepID=UPI0003423B74|nr:hypothetical protein [Salinarchaeum sp. Harcht-Bsk1]AGN02439.1 hypothetical protein L593_12500 [Salinarchaeum sp. Harcht-Bsk1]